MRSFYFGKERRLCGALHEPSGSPKSTGVLLCYPGVQEYNPTHWAFRKLAGLLAREGFHTLRFDYSCTGDSAGDAYGAKVEHHVEDIATAAEELRDATGVGKVSLVGMRLGALLATDAVSRGLQVRDLVLWEPVGDGREYVGDLERLDEHLASHKQHRITEPRIELAGYPFSRRMREELEALSLEALLPRAAARVSMLVMADTASTSQARVAWERQGVRVTSRLVSEAGGGLKGGVGAGDSAVHYAAMLTAIVQQLKVPMMKVAA